MKQLRITVAGKSYDVEVELLNETNGASSPRPAPVASARVAAPAAPARAATAPPVVAPAGDGAVASPLAAVVVSVEVGVGDSVEAGQNVVTLEAMKMLTTISAGMDGTVTEIVVHKGEAVESDDLLAKLEP